MPTLKEIITYSKANPNTDYAKQAYQHIQSGAFDEQAAQEGVDLSFAGRPKLEPKRTVSEKILDFTGGKEIAQGVGQALANPKIAKQQKQVQDEQIKIQTTLLQRIKEKKALGEDTSHLEKTLQDIGGNIAVTGTETGELLNQKGLTTKQVLGDALQLATTAGGAKVAGAVGGKMTGATGVLKGIAQGAKTGALGGAAVGGLTGVSQGLQEDMTGKEILKEGGKGVLTGAVAGGILGAATGGITGGIKASKLAKESRHLESVTPKTKDLTPTEYEDLLNKGKITPRTATKEPQYILSDKEKEVASKYKDILVNKDPVKNHTNIINEIAKKDKEVETFLKKNNGIFNTGELKNSLTKKLADVDDLTVDEKRLTKLKKATIDNFVKSLKKNDMESLWKARKEFDRKIESSFSGSPTLQKEIKREFRNAVQDFISENTPDKVYKTKMTDMSELFNLRDIVANKATKEKGTNAIRLWIKNNPTKAKLVGGAATLIGGDLVYQHYIK